jgi:hypothetical protein
MLHAPGVLIIQLSRILLFWMQSSWPDLIRPARSDWRAFAALSGAAGATPVMTGVPLASVMS